MDIVERVKAILLTPQSEWLAIERESGDPAYLFKNYVAILDVGITGRPNGVSHGGQYDDTYEKTPVGWRFKKRVYWESKVETRILQAPAAR